MTRSYKATKRSVIRCEAQLRGIAPGLLPELLLAGSVKVNGDLAYPADANQGRWLIARILELLR